ncbi:MAG: GAF domain-containing protein [Methylotenera sp.]
MESPIVPINEIQRLAALKRSRLLDTSSEEVFDDFTKLASQICETPIALITLLDDTRQWFKSNIGLNVSETPRKDSFCTHAILESKLFEIPDALNDERFRKNPLVASEPQIRFYAGMPLITKDGYAFGTLCVIDTTPRHLTFEQRSALQMLGRQVVVLIEYRLNLIETTLINHDLTNIG